MPHKLVLKQESKHLAAVRRAASAAGKIMLKNYGKISADRIETKAVNDFVTDVDKRMQEKIISVLVEEFPGYGLLAEEDGVNIKKDRTWVIDPLDGTANYIHGIPAFCVSIALIEHETMLLGLVYDALHEEWFYATRGKGAFLNKKRIHVSQTTKLADAFLATGFPFRSKHRFETYEKSFRRIFHKTSGVRRLGSAALDLCYAACGRYDGFWEMGLQPWDIAGGAIIVEEAGGSVFDFNMKKNYMQTGNTLAGNKAIVRGLGKILKTIPQPPDEGV